MYCGNCGTKQHEESGLCPMCEAEALARYEATPAFCATCGGQMDRKRGVCPQCEQNAASAAVTEAPKSAAKKTSPLKTVLTALMATLLVLISALIVVVGAARVVVSEETIDLLLEEADWGACVEAIPGEDRDSLYRSVDRRCGTDVDDKEMRKFLETSDTQDFIKDVVLDVIDGVLDGEDVKIRDDDIADLLEDNTEFFVEELRCYFSGLQIAGITEDICYEGEPVIPTGDVKEDSLPLYLLIYAASADYVIVVLLALFVIVLAVMLINHAPQGLTAGGTVLAAMGALFAALDLIMLAALPGSNWPNEFLCGLIVTVLDLYWLPCLIATAVGIVMIAVGILVGKFTRKAK